MLIYLNTDQIHHGGPLVWSSRFRKSLVARGFKVSEDLSANWDAALFILGTNGMDVALKRGKPVAYRVANGYDPKWFQATGREMRAEHHAGNSAIARALEIADFIVYQSQWAKSQIDQNLYNRSERFAVILNGVDLDQFHPQKVVNSDIPILGTVGVMRYRFRLETFFEMSRRLDIPHRLLVIGKLDEECQAILRQAQADPLIESRLTYQAQVPPEDLPELYGKMSLLVHPVCGDVCPNVVAEALACGVPAIAPEFGGTAELIGDAGFTFDCEPWIYDDRFVTALTSSVKNALEKSEDLRIKARHQAESSLDLEKMVDRYLEVMGLPSRPLAKQVQSVPLKSRFRQSGTRLLARPRFYTALAIRRANRFQRRLRKPKPNRKPRIAFTLFDFHIGGIENWLYRLAHELRSDFDFYFLATKIPDFLPKFHQVGTCAFTPSPVQMITFLQKNNIDLVQVHNERWPVDAALAAGTTYIIERLGGQRSWRRVPKYGIDLVIASAQAGVNAIQDMIPPDRVRLIYNGIDLNEVDNTSANRVFPEDALVIGRTSRFGQGQNLGLLIRALAQLSSNYPSLRLVLVGGDSLMTGAKPVEAELRQLTTDLGIQDRVYFTGLVENSLPFIQGFDIGTCVSNDEGVPNSLIEAMACRKAVISTDVGAIKELIQHERNGLLIPPGNQEALCAALKRMIIDAPLRNQLAEAARKTIEERFSLQKSAQQYRDVYSSLLSRDQG